MHLIYRNDTATDRLDDPDQEGRHVNVRVVAGADDVTLSFYEHGDPPMPIDANGDAILILYPGTDLFADGDVEVQELSDEALAALAPAPPAFADVVEDDAVHVVYRNDDDDEESWIRVTAKREVHLTLDPSCPPVTVAPGQPRTLMVAPGREVLADGKVTIRATS